MNEFAISIENLGKQYQITGSRGAQVSLRDTITSLFARGEDRAQNQNELFWALDDINLNVRPGEVVGVIGRNGAGKSTLLKILSRITEPTRGRVRIRGRVSSLLEVGTGFHPELSGRENVYLNGAILGMSKEEIRKNFDEIVEFAEVGRFIDTPLKRYSSGMMVRLAFSVAAHLQPEILIIDEVLAVGDAQFQKKCLGRIEDAAGENGRTIFFVSHQMNILQAICKRCVLLSHGKLMMDGETSQVIRHYLERGTDGKRFETKIQKSGAPTLTTGEVFFEETRNGTTLKINLGIETRQADRVGLQVFLKDGTGQAVGYGCWGYLQKGDIELRPGENSVSFKISSDVLAVGSYYLTLSLVRLSNVDVQNLHQLDDILQFDVIRSPGEEENRVLQQSWGNGSVQFRLERI